MIRKELIRWLSFFGTLLICSTAYAHTTHAHVNGFVAGIGHPVLGIDHFLAMVAVGIVSARIAGKAIWTIPLVFVLCMMVGGMIGGYLPNLPFVEFGIVSSVIALGLVIAMGKNIMQIIAMVFVGIFGLFHGYAHGTEMPAMANPLFYGAGFVTGTIGLHLLGVLIGWGADKFPRGSELLRASGGLMSMVGLYFFATLIV